MNIIITGASSGVGFEAAIELTATTKHKLIVLARTQEKLVKLQEIAQSLNPECVIYPVVFDLVNDDHHDLKAFVNDRFNGQLDVLINNAGALINKPFEQLGEMDFVEMLQSNFLSHVRITQTLLPLVKEGGHIVNIGSMGGFQGSAKFKGLSAYSASKAALHNFTETLAMELADLKISVNCLALGSAQTEMLEAAFPGYQSPVMAFEMGKYIADFAVTGHKFFNGKILPVAVTTP
ncbi:SDR family NAD(P)-dependent oxidoreductase [Mucilaginibacter ginkgonis]|uniref:SDR family oxidoreductase n=1 Tax=Mucilaginibacter ginkgonis TaxID=2682091 RepID=A0A6I4HWZ9_9SPHI|nr:SDR family oxidoreductase [Mucilaginibacter ginkgonis]QQL49856.1 SDR family oxidoreductase [Mucilaginibacter ginkgonis]